MKKQVGKVQIEAVQGDIANQPDIEAVVNAANAMLMPGGGVAGAIHRAAGPALAEECSKFAPIKPGEAVITGAHGLPNKYGMDKPENRLLAECYHNSLLIADQNNIQSVAFPAISTGAFGYPFEAATDIALTSVIEVIPEMENVNHIRFVLFGDIEFEIYLDRLRNLKD